MSNHTRDKNRRFCQLVAMISDLRMTMRRLISTYPKSSQTMEIKDLLTEVEKVDFILRRKMAMSGITCEKD